MLDVFTEVLEDSMEVLVLLKISMEVVETFMESVETFTTSMKGSMEISVPSWRICSMSHFVTPAEAWREIHGSITLPRE